MAFDVGVIGWDMPYASGFEVLEALRARPDAPRIVVYTGSAAPNLAREAMALGAAGFCSKRQSPERLIETIIAVARGAMVFPFFDVRTDRTDPFGDLTPRERELLAALPSGRTNAQIAKDLGLSVNTVKFHLKSLYDKLSVRNRAQAVALHLQRPAGGHDKPDRR
jgi:two-component system nitrate/nitrite response regulator NarP